MDLQIIKTFTIDFTLKDLEVISRRLKNNTEYIDTPEGEEHKRQDDKIINKFIALSNKAFN